MRAPRNSLRECLDAVFGDGRMRARMEHAAHNLSAPRQFVLNFLRIALVRRKGGLEAQRLIAAASYRFRTELLGLVKDLCDRLGNGPPLAPASFRLS